MLMSYPTLQRFADSRRRDELRRTARVRASGANHPHAPEVVNSRSGRVHAHDNLCAQDRLFENNRVLGTLVDGSSTFLEHLPPSSGLARQRQEMAILSGVGRISDNLPTSLNDFEIYGSTTLADVSRFEAYPGVVRARRSAL